MSNLNVTGNITCQTGAVVPIGTILDFAGATPPEHYLLCNGQAVSRTEYAELFALLGTTWGVGDFKTTFNVPNLQGKMTISAGTNAGTTYSFGSWAGSKDAVVISHSHTFSGTNKQGRVGGFRTENNQNLVCESPFSADNSLMPSDSNWWDSPDNDWGLKGFKFDYTPSGTISTEGESGVNKNMPPYVVVNKIIRAR